MCPLILSITVCCLMSACAFGTPPMRVEPIRVPPPANLTMPPEPLPPPASGAMRDLEANHRQVARQYHQLASQTCLLLLYLEINHDACSRYVGTTP